MRLIVTGKSGDRVVDAAPVDICSGSEHFAAHRSIDVGLCDVEAWSVTHVETGFRIASGATAAAALENARAKWASTTPQQHAMAFAHAHDMRAGRQSKALDEALS